MANPDTTMNVELNVVLTGWICPNCGRGMNPKVKRCKCVKNGAYKIEPIIESKEATEKYRRQTWEHIASSPPFVFKGFPTGKEHHKEEIETKPDYNNERLSITDEDVCQTMEHLSNHPPFGAIDISTTLAVQNGPASSGSTRGTGNVLKNEPTKMETLHYGAEVRIGNANSPYFGQHGSYTRDETTEEGLKKVITMFKSGDQVKVTDAEIKVASDES